MVESGWFKDTKHLFWMIIFVSFFILAIDIWNWGFSEPLVLGLPYWIIYHIVLTVSLSVIFWLFARAEWREQDD